MKKVILLFLSLYFLLTACGTGSGSASAGKKTTRKFNAAMSMDEYNLVTNDVVGFATDISDAFFKMQELTQKYAVELNGSESYDWSEHWDFRETKDEIIKVCDNILQYNDQSCSQEYQYCMDEMKSMAYQIKEYFNQISKERDIDELLQMTQRISNDVTLGMNNALIYQLMATITYMRQNDGDPDAIAGLESQVKDAYVFKMTAEGSGESGYTGKLVFTNSYGTVETKCSHSGCSNTIASSGDTNCCIVHSQKCLNCGKYIDGDAVFCMDCLNGTTTAISDSGKYSKKSAPANGCKYSYFDGSVCGKATSGGATLCDRHFKELNDIYNSLVGG